MARLEFYKPFKEASLRDLTAMRADSRTREVTSVDGKAKWVVRGSDGDSMSILLSKALSGEPGHVEVGLTLDTSGSLSPEVIQRFNRLFKGTGVALLWYHRAGGVRLNIPGKWLDIPSSVRYSWASGLVHYTDRSGSGWVAVRPKGAKVETISTAVAFVPERSVGSAIEAAVAAGEAYEAGLRAEREVPVEVAAAIATPEVQPSTLKAPKAPRVDERGIFKYPLVTPLTEVVVTTDTLAGLDRLWAMHVAGKRQVMAFVGPTGTGKTSLAYNLAAKHDVGIMVFDAMGAREFSDWVGTTHMRDGETKFIPSGFLQAIDADGPYAGQFRIILIDEVTRAESTGALNVLMPVLHGFSSLYVPEMGRGVNIDPAVMFVLTANRGSQYGGTVGMDLAVIDRVASWVMFDYMSADAEAALLVRRTGITRENALLLHRAATQVRNVASRGDLPEGGGVSTRRLITAAEKVVGGFNLYDAAAWSWLGAYPSEGSPSEKDTVQSTIESVLRGR